MSNLNFSAYAKFVVKAKNELYETTERIIEAIFETSKETEYVKGAYNLPFPDGALWMGNNAPCTNIVVKGLIYEKKLGRYFLMGIKDKDIVRISIKTLTLDDLKSLICFMDKNGFDLNMLKDYKKNESSQESDKKDEDKEEASEKNESDENAQKSEQNEEPESETEQEHEACYIGKPINPTEKVFD